MSKELNILSPLMNISINVYVNDDLLITTTSSGNSTHPQQNIVYNNEVAKPAQQPAQQESAQPQAQLCEGPHHSIESTLPPEVNITWEDFLDNDINDNLFDFNNSFDPYIFENKHDELFITEIESEIDFFNKQQSVEPEQNEPVITAAVDTIAEQPLVPPVENQAVIPSMRNHSPRANSPVDIRTDVTSLDTSVSIQKDTSVSVQKGPLRRKRGRPPKKRVKSIFQEIQRGVTGCSKCRWSRNGCNGIRCKRNVPLNVNKNKKKKSSHNFSDFSTKHKSQNY